MADSAPEAGFRCSAAALERGDELAGTASTFRTFLLVEHPGPWGSDALTEARLPEDVGARLKARCAPVGVRPLLVRRGVRSGTDEGIGVFAAHTRAGRSWLAATRLRSYHQLADIDPAALARGERPPGWRPLPGPFFAVCTHGKHDACCAERGRPVAAALREAGVPDAWEVSHIGGDRFAANMLVLPGGFYYGGLDDQSVLRVAEGHRRDRVTPELLRGRSSYAMPVQYAEVALLRHLDESRVDALRLRSREVDGPVTRVVFAHEGRDWSVTVRSERLGPARLTCSALRDNPVPRHVVVDGPRPV